MSVVSDVFARFLNVRPTLWKRCVMLRKHLSDEYHKNSIEFDFANVADLNGACTPAD
jgi:hypothetical protein